MMSVKRVHAGTGRPVEDCGLLPADVAPHKTALFLLCSLVLKRSRDSRLCVQAEENTERSSWQVSLPVCPATQCACDFRVQA